MAIIGTFGSYSAAIFGIHNAQTAMHVTGNNIGNINTTGYTRQRAEQTSMYDTGTARYQSPYNHNIGYGAIVENVSQLRDPFLDIRFRNENASLGYYESMQEGLQQLSHILDEVGKGNEGFGTINAKLGDFKNALRELEQYPDSTQHDDLVNAAASTLCRLFNSAAKELQSVYTNERNKLMESTNEVNKILYNIRDLNEQIRTQSVYGGNALELRDARNVQIDKLSKYMKINVSYSMEYMDGGIEVEKLSISMDNTTDPNTGKEFVLVDGIFASQLLMPETTPKVNTQYDPENGAGMQYWVNGQPTNNLAAATAKNKAYKPNTAPYLDKNSGLPTWSAKTKDDDNDPNPAYYRYMTDSTTANANPDDVVAIPVKDADGNPVTPAQTLYYTNNRDLATVGKNDTATNNTAITNVAVYDATNPVGYKYIAMSPDEINEKFGLTVTANGTLNAPGSDYAVLESPAGSKIYYTNNPDYAVQEDNFAAGSTDNLYLYTLDALRNKDNRVMNVGTEDESLAVELGDNDVYGALQAIRELLTEEGEFASREDLLRDPDAATKRGIRFYQHMLDSFAQKFAQSFNTDNQISGEDIDKVYMTDPGGGTGAGTTFVHVDNKNTPPNKFVMKPEDPTTELTSSDVKNLYAKITDPDNKYPGYPKDDEAYADYLKDVQTYQSYMDALRSSGKLTEEYDYYDGGVLFSNNGNSNDPTGITAANISVSNAWSEGAVRVLNRKDPNIFSIDENGNRVKQDSLTSNSNLAHMMSFMDWEMDYVTTDTVRDAAIDPNKAAFFTGTFQQMWGRAPALLGDDSQATNLLTYTYSTTTLNLDNDRISVSGVDLNEEATDMMKFSQAFSAACQLLTTIDSMLDKLINNTIR